METKGKQKGNMKKTTIQKMYDDNTLGIGEWCDNKIYRKDKKLNFVEWDNDDVKSLVSEILHTLQDDYGYLNHNQNLLLEIYRVMVFIIGKLTMYWKI